MIPLVPGMDRCPPASQPGRHIQLTAAVPPRSSVAPVVDGRGLPRKRPAAGTPKTLRS